MNIQRTLWWRTVCLRCGDPENDFSLRRRGQVPVEDAKTGYLLGWVHDYCADSRLLRVQRV